MKLDISRIHDFLSKQELERLYPETRAAIKTLYEGSGEGNDFLGWLNLPNEVSEQALCLMEEAAADFREISRT